MSKLKFTDLRTGDRLSIRGGMVGDVVPSPGGGVLALRAKVGIFDANITFADGLPPDTLRLSYGKDASDGLLNAVVKSVLKGDDAERDQLVCETVSSDSWREKLEYLRANAQYTERPYAVLDFAHECRMLLVTVDEAEASFGVEPEDRIE